MKSGSKAPVAGLRYAATSPARHEDTAAGAEEGV